MTETKLQYSEENFEMLYENLAAVTMAFRSVLLLCHDLETLRLGLGISEDAIDALKSVRGKS